MAWQYTPFTTPRLVTAALVAVAAFYVVRQQRAYEPVPGGYTAVAVSLLISWTLATYALQLGRVGHGEKLLWYRLGYLGFMPVPGLLAVFALQYTHRERYLTRWSTALLFSVPLAMIALAFTNEGHHLVWTTTPVVDFSTFQALAPEYGPAALAYAAYSTVAVLAAIGLLVQRVRATKGIYRRQAIFLVSGMVVPFVAGVAYLFEYNPLPELEIMTVSLAVTGLTFSWAVARHGLFTLVPIASQAAVTQMDDAVIVIDVRGLVISVNPQAEAFLTVDPGEAVGGSVGDVLRPFAVPPAPDEHRSESDREVVTDPDTGRYYQRIGTPLTDGDGVLMGQLIVLQDITERFRREKRLRQQNEQLEEFASVVSHDLRNPLNVISARAQLARETGDREHFDRLDRATDRMDRLIDDLLQLARQGQTVDETEEVDLGAVATDAWELVSAPDADLLIDAEITLEADPDRLQQALENLFRNAVDHVGQTVSLRIEPLEDGFAVVDDGPGIPPEERDQIFEYGHTSAADGTGFGLAIVREIVEAHGWSIRAVDGDLASDDDEFDGARFEVTGVSTARSFSLSAAEHGGFEFG
ncbi:MAG: histidine kinase N-terminal 7TM domain-containing protein [Haloarculaceae archaeon]